MRPFTSLATRLVASDSNTTLHPSAEIEASLLLLLPALPAALTLINSVWFSLRSNRKICLEPFVAGDTSPVSEDSKTT